MLVLGAVSCGPPPGDGGGGTDASAASACFDGADNDGDALTDFPNDPGCVDAADDDEAQPPECGDGLDNDADGAIDLADVGCAGKDDPSELNPQCADGADNDGDGRIDFPSDPDCNGLTDEREAEDAACQDLTDNDGDGAVDFPADPGCADAADPSESDVPDCAGMLFVTDVTATGLLSGSSAAGAPSYFAGSCGGAGPEGIGFVDVPVPLSLLSVNAFGTAFDTTIHLRTDCGAASSELACGAFDVAAGESPVIELTGVAPGSYYLFADGTAAGDVGQWFLHVFGIIAPGQACLPGDLVFRCDSVTGQVCSEPIPGAGNVCNAGQCSDGFDNDGDGIIDYPLDPGCIAPSDNAETDPPVTPECFDAADNDGDGFTDYPADPGCSATGDDLEIDDCIAGVPLDLLAPDGTGSGSTGGPSNFEGTCTASFTPSGPEDVWVFELPYTADVTVTTRLPGTTLDTAIYVRTDCPAMGSEIGCNDNDPSPPFTSASTLLLPGLAPGTYFVFVDGMAGGAGAYELEVSGVYASGAPCDPASLSFVCNALVGDVCQDPGTGFACLPAQCDNGTDDDGDAVTDYPAEPGCLVLSDDDETDPAVPPVCSNGADDDADLVVDYPMDPGCFYAADPTEEDNCIPGVPFTDLPPTGSYSGSITAFTGSFEGSCTAGFSPSAGENVFIVSVPTASTVTFTTDLPGTFLDTALYLRSVCDDAGTELACNDNALAGGGFTSSSTITIALGPGTYFLFVDGMNGSTGAYQLSVTGVVTGGNPCDPSSLIFSCDTAAGFACLDPGTGTTVCTAGACSDTIDNDSDALADYPVDPGCLTLADTDETDGCPGAGCPQCGDGIDNDADLLVDYPTDVGCGAASDDDEEACIYDFDDGTAMGWTFSNTCTSGVGWVVDSFRSTSGAYSLYYGNPATRTFDCGGLTNSGTATSPSVTLPATGSEITFWYRWDSEGCGFDELTLEVDPAIGSPVEIWSRCTDPVTSAGSSGGVFVERTISLSAYDGQTVQLVWRFDTLDGIGNSFEGTYLDDLFVNGSCP